MAKAPQIVGLPKLPGAGAVVSGEKRWLPVFQSFIDELRIQSKEVAADDERGTKLDLWGSQLIFLKNMADGMDQGIRDFYCLKSRQLGVTTVSLAIDLFWCATHPRMLGVIVADTDKNSAFFRTVLKGYYNSLPAEFRGSGFEKIRDNAAGMEFSNGSRLDFLVAGERKKNWGEGRGYTLAHMCMAKGTPVVLEHGRIKPIEDVKVGDRLLTHTGKDATVIDVAGQPGVGKRIVRIQPWLGHGINYTDWHKIPTQRGLLEAKDVRKTDLLIMPVRKITGGTKVVRLPESRGRSGTHFVDAAGRFVSAHADGAILRERGRWVNVEGAGSGHEMALTEEVGFAIGYYLAEGCLKQTRVGEFSGVIFARHRGEKDYADRAIAALRPFTTKSRRTHDREESLTSTDEIYGTPLATWIAETFGQREDKFISDEVFSWGKEFCRGLLCGLLTGDGSKTATTAQCYSLNQVVLPTTRSSLAMQARDIAASLGLGWASIAFKEGGVHSGRNCKPCWRVTWNGAAAASLRSMMGLPEIRREGHNYTNKYVLEDDRVLIRIRSIEEMPDEPEIWDISVDHQDHTFRTPYMATGNTEVAAYGTPEGIASFRETLAESNEDRLFIWESTAKGMNQWKSMYDAAKEDRYTKRAMFIGWWSKAINSIARKDPRFGDFGSQPPDFEEKEKVALVLQRHGVSISMEQLAWRRWRDADSSVDKADLDQNQPWLEEEAFVQSGYSFFATRVVSKMLEKVYDVATHGIVYFPYRFYLGRTLYESKMEAIPPSEIDQRGTDVVEMRVWEDPVEGATYVIGCDPAYGRNEWKDRSAVSVWRCFADRLVQVAEYADSRSETYQIAWVLAYLAGFYKDCIVNIELTGGPGLAVFKELDDKRLEYRSENHQVNFGKKDETGDDGFLTTAKNYMWRRPDSMGKGFAYHTQMSGRYKFQWMNQLRDSLLCGFLDIKSAPLLEEMMTVVQDGAEIAAPGRMKDDRVFAALYAHMAWKDNVQPAMIARGQSYELVMASEDGQSTVAQTAVTHIVANFWKRAEEARLNPAEPASSFFDKRGM